MILNTMGREACAVCNLTDWPEQLLHPRILCKRETTHFHGGVCYCNGVCTDENLLKSSRQRWALKSQEPSSF